MNVRRAIEQELFPGKNFDAPAEVYSDLARLLFEGTTVVITPSLECLDVEPDDILRAQAEATATLISRVSNRAVYGDFSAGTNESLEALANAVRQRRETE